MVARLYPANCPSFFAGNRRYQNPGRGSEMWGPVSQYDAGGLIDAGGVRVDGGVHFQNGDTLTETLRLTLDTLDAAHCIKEQYNPNKCPDLWRDAHGHCALDFLSIWTVSS